MDMTMTQALKIQADQLNGLMPKLSAPCFAALAAECQRRNETTNHAYMVFRGTDMDNFIANWRPAPKPAIATCDKLFKQIEAFGSSSLIQQAQGDFDARNEAYLASSEEYQNSEEGALWSVYLQNTEHMLLVVNGFINDCLNC